jgi:Domain of unknown function (DU1801)
MVELKTKQTEANAADFLSGVADENVRADCRKIAALMEEATGAKPKMWGDSIVGFGSRTMKYSTGRELQWLEVGFSPRKANLTLYLAVSEGIDDELLGKLGKHKTGKGCLYFKRLSDVDEKVLEKLIEKSVENTRR